VVPFLFLVGAAVLEIRTLLDRPRQSLTGIVLILLGLPFYFYWKSRRNKSPSVDFSAG
jgi:APA family basic amino acid/polyamine antiporter